MHRLIFATAWPDIAGQYRQTEIDAFSTTGDLPPHHTEVPSQMLAFGRDLARKTMPQSRPKDAAAATRLGIWAHMELVRIHPFQEGNGRTARLLLDVVMMRHVTGSTRPLVIEQQQGDRYIRCVQEARMGRPEAFEDFVADLLEKLVRQEEQIRSSSIWSRFRRRRQP